MDKRKIPTAAIVLLFVTIVAWWMGSLPARAAQNEFFIDVRDADLRDILSALAIKTGTNIVLIESPSKISFSVENVSPMRALELLLQSEGLGYVREGDLLIVGREDKLKANSLLAVTLIRFDLVYLRANQLQPLLAALDLAVKSFVLDTNPRAIWVEGTAEDLVKVKQLIAAVDYLENAVYEGDEVETLTLSYRELPAYAVDPERLAEMVKKVGVPLQKYLTIGNRLLVFDRDIIHQWDEFYGIMTELDTIDARKNSVFSFKFENIVARDGATRLAAFGYTNVRTVSYNFPEFSHELIIICPPEMESQVFASLIVIDEPPERINAPIMSATGEFARRELQAKRRLLAEMAGIPMEHMKISENIAGDPDRSYHVLWANETPDRIKLLQDLVQRF